mmetsp:Transcript_16807/g.47711  ORF Transcript_16807/g.47711 Transcript_16807/m.47711 type:complete len:267 (-) Transcript_16807:706-1506(-)
MNCRAMSTNLSFGSLSAASSSSRWRSGSIFLFCPSSFFLASKSLARPSGASSSSSSSSSTLPGSRMILLSSSTPLRISMQFSKTLRVRWRFARCKSAMSSWEKRSEVSRLVTSAMTKWSTLNFGNFVDFTSFSFSSVESWKPSGACAAFEPRFSDCPSLCAVTKKFWSNARFDFSICKACRNVLRLSRQHFTLSWKEMWRHMHKRRSWTSGIVDTRYRKRCIAPNSISFNASSPRSSTMAASFFRVFSSVSRAGPRCAKPSVRNTP